MEGGWNSAAVCAGGDPARMLSMASRESVAFFHERHPAFESWDALARVLTGKLIRPLGADERRCQL